MENLLEEKYILNALQEDFEMGYELLLSKIKNTRDKIKILENMYDTAKKFNLELLHKIHDELDKAKDLLKIYIGIKIKNCELAKC